MLFAQCRDAGCSPRTPLRWGRTGPRLQGHTGVGAGGQELGASPSTGCQGSFTSAPCL